MKINKKILQQIIKEEIYNLLREQAHETRSRTPFTGLGKVALLGALGLTAALANYQRQKPLTPPAPATDISTAAPTSDSTATGSAAQTDNSDSDGIATDDSMEIDTDTNSKSTKTAVGATKPPQNNASSAKAGSKVIDTLGPKQRAKIDAAAAKWTISRTQPKTGEKSKPVEAPKTGEKSKPVEAPKTGSAVTDLAGVAYGHPLYNQQTLSAEDRKLGQQYLSTAMKDSQVELTAKQKEDAFMKGIAASSKARQPADAKGKGGSVADKTK